MSSDITLTAAVRQNLLSLQNTAATMATVQNRLATGKKVNSALDNPLNFFTSQSLSNRASDLNALLDSIGQAQQTLSTADQGITSLTSLVNSAKSIATQAQQSATPTATYSLAITGNTAIAADTSRVLATNTYASKVGGLTASAKSTYTIDTAAIATAASVDGNNFTISDGTHSYRFEADVAGDGVTGGSIGFKTKADLKTALNSIFGGSATTVGDVVTVTGADFTTSFQAATGTAGLTAGVAKTAAVDGDKLTLTQGSTSSTFRYVASGAVAGNGTFTSLSDLEAAVAADANVGNAGPGLNAKVLATDDGAGHLKLESNGSFTVGGTVATALGDSGTNNLNYNSTLAGLTGVLSVQVGTGAAQTIDFGSVTTKAQLSTALAGLTGVTASINGGNDISITSTSSDNVTLTGTNNAASGLFTGANIGVNAPSVQAGTNSAVRTGLQAQYNSLLTQIDQLAGDSSYNGINLLNGDNLKVTFNESGTSSLTISGVTLNSGGLGLSSLVGNEFQDNTQIGTVVNTLNNALTTLRSQASAFGSTLTTVQTRQDFTKNLVNTLQTGSDNLVLADTNQEGANLLALQTRQSLSTTALSLANQANQAVLQLLH